MTDSAAARRLASDLMPVCVVVAGQGAEALAGLLAEAGLAAETLQAGADAGPADLAILLADPGQAASPAMSATVAQLSQASDRLLLVPHGDTPAFPALDDLLAWFEIFAELGYQPVVDFDAGFMGQGAFLVDRSATAAESELGAFAERLSLGGALAASSQRVASLEAELAGGERAVQAELAAQQAQNALLARDLAAMTASVRAAELEATQAREEAAAQNAAWEALRGWVRAVVARAAPPPKRRLLGNLFAGRRKPASGNDLALIRTSPLFDAAWYIASHPELAEDAADPVHHYLVSGAASGADPGPWFDTAAYLREHPDAAASGQNPLVHAIRAEARK